MSRTPWSDLMRGVSAGFVGYLFLRELYYARHQGLFQLLASAIVLLGAAACVSASARRSGWLWGALFALQAAVLLPVWHRVDNHLWLTAYWTLACACSLLSSDPDDALRQNARRLIGLAFAFAAVWKLIGGQYLNGAFLQDALLTHHRLSGLSRWAGLVSDDQLQAIQRAMVHFRGTAGTALELIMPHGPALRGAALALSWWTLLIEVLLACAFLSGFARLARYRDALLIGFVLTTYLVAPVAAFAWLLSILGATSRVKDPHRWGMYYLATTLLVSAVTIVRRS